ncbi:MAG: hypothetical protein AVDCRST_MAG41-817 [uncultured Corynebacteriales bacterium]|uniref:Uncharacterized protein n=1 Tax=uncultured Mycobacteriales bacterium TaxID=581187 RepID=A0A6J4HN07_9ACTN|nr:MAG: hypothetical protein AVDCRST_MAG41-817 [uncultured Corynebacteriales bacterium]
MPGCGYGWAKPGSDVRLRVGAVPLVLAAVVVLVAAVSTGILFRRSPDGLEASGHVVVAGPSTPGRASSVGGPWLCSHGRGPVRLRSIEPVTLIGRVEARTAVRRIQTATATDLVGGGDGPLPASYDPVAGAAVPS